MARLILHPGTPQARPLDLKPGVNRLGRAASNDLTIEEGAVSGSHCEIVVSDGGVQIRDLNSTNGTFVDGVAVTEASIRPGQRIQLGSVQLLFESDGDTSAIIQANTPPATRLRVSTVQHAPPPQRVEVEEFAPPSLPLNVPVNAPCKYHPRSFANWMCTECRKTFCDLCVTARPGVPQKFCRSCAAACVPLQVVADGPRELSFFRDLPRTAIYPFRGSGVLILIVATLVFAALDFVSIGLLGIFIKALALGYLFSYVQNILHSTAAGDERMPEMPGMDDVWMGFFRLAGTVLMSFGPALVLAYFAIAQEQPLAGIALIPAIIFGCVYFPMAFLAVAMKDNVMASNPLVVVPSILRVPLEYLVAVILTAGVFAVRWAGDMISSVMAGESLFTTSMGTMFLLFGLRVIWAFISIYLLTVSIRILGLLYLTKRDRLGW